MMPFIKDGKGQPSWTATLLIFYVLFYFSCYYIGFFCEEQVALFAQRAWDAVNLGLFGILATYVGRRGTEVYERVKNGKKPDTTGVMGAIGNLIKAAEEKDKELEDATDA
jgi:hypothetical protein